MNRTLKLESIRQIYYKHKIFFFKQIINNQLYKNGFEYLRKYFKIFDRESYKLH